MRNVSHWIKWSMASLWIISAVAGMTGLVYYSSLPGKVGTLSQKWPSAIAMPGGQQKPSLIVFLHPRCGCSKATMSDLERLMTEAQGRLQLRIVFFKPTGETDQWIQTDLWRRAKSLPDVQLSIDEDGRLGEEFGAQTSGMAYLYGVDQKLVFAGGLTPARGHEGDSEGQRAILQYVWEHASPPTQVSSVFGCDFANGLSNEGKSL